MLSWLGVGALAALLIAEVLLIRRWIALPVGVAAVAVGVAAVVAAIALVALTLRLASSLTLHYVLDHQTLTIVRGAARWVVPLCALERVYTGESRAVLVERELMPGFTFGRGYVPDGGRVLFFTTRPPAAAVALRTASCTYLISPVHADQFVAAVEAQRAQAGPAEAREPGEGFLVALRQPAAILLTAGAALADAALYAYVAWWYPAFPNAMPVHFNAAGLADRWGPAFALFWLPEIGTIVLVANVLLSVLLPLRRPMTALLLLASALMVQVFLWVAFLRLLP